MLPVQAEDVAAPLAGGAADVEALSQEPRRHVVEAGGRGRPALRPPPGAAPRGRSVPDGEARVDLARPDTSETGAPPRASRTAKAQRAARAARFAGGPDPAEHHRQGPLGDPLDAAVVPVHGRGQGAVALAGIGAITRQVRRRSAPVSCAGIPAGRGSGARRRGGPRLPRAR